MLVVYSDWRLLLAWLAFIVLMSVVAPLQAAFIKGEDSAETKKKKGKEDTSKSAEAATSANRIVGDAVMGIRTVASFNLEQPSSTRASRKRVAARWRPTPSGARRVLWASASWGVSDFTMFSGMGPILLLHVARRPGPRRHAKGDDAAMWCVMGMMVPMMKAGALADLKRRLQRGRPPLPRL